MDGKIPSRVFRNINTRQDILKYTLVCRSKTFISNSGLKLTKNQAKTKQHPEAELLIFENYSLSSSMLSVHPRGVAKLLFDFLPISA